MSSSTLDFPTQHTCYLPCIIPIHNPRWQQIRSYSEGTKKRLGAYTLFLAMTGFDGIRYLHHCQHSYIVVVEAVPLLGVVNFVHSVLELRGNHRIQLREHLLKVKHRFAILVVSLFWIGIVLFEKCFVEFVFVATVVAIVDESNCPAYQVGVDEVGLVVDPKSCLK